ncbi:MAG TPA: hypothetical protein VN901_29940 [Candidatus Acidoferrales bacterium]|nr:hypothetical protein [Candidatus Acidoferrales bacterium]
MGEPSDKPADWQTPKLPPPDRRTDHLETAASTFSTECRVFASVPLAVLILTSAIAGETDSPNEVFKGVDTYITSETAQHCFRGTVLVGKGGKILFVKAYGMADEEWQGKRSGAKSQAVGHWNPCEAFVRLPFL